MQYPVKFVKNFIVKQFKNSKKVVFPGRVNQMWWYGRGNSGGSWLQEEKKANMWHRRGNSGGSWPPAFPRSNGKVFGLGRYF